MKIPTKNLVGWIKDDLLNCVAKGFLDAKIQQQKGIGKISSSKIETELSPLVEAMSGGG